MRPDHAFGRRTTAYNAPAHRDGLRVVNCFTAATVQALAHKQVRERFQRLLNTTRSTAGHIAGTSESVENSANAANPVRSERQTDNVSGHTNTPMNSLLFNRHE